MNLGQFLYSLVLLVLGQVPLVVKLWLDHRAKIDPFRKELFERQLMAFSDIYIAITNLHWRLFSEVQFYGVDFDSTDHREFWQEIRKALGKASSEWSTVLRRSEFLLPSGLVKITWDYHVGAAKITFACLEKEKRTSLDEVQQKWGAQTQLYNQIINEMRIRLGVDSLSRELLKMVEERTTQLVVSGFDPSLIAKSEVERP